MTPQAGRDRQEAAARRAVRLPNDGPRRPLPPAVAWRWRYEIAVAVAVPAVVVFLLAIMGWRWTMVDVVVIGIFLAACPPAREFTAARARCVVTAHRIRTGCAEAYLVSRRGAARRSAAHLLDKPDAIWRACAAVVPRRDRGRRFRIRG